MGEWLGGCYWVRSSWHFVAHSAKDWHLGGSSLISPKKAHSGHVDGLPDWQRWAWFYSQAWLPRSCLFIKVASIWSDVMGVSSFYSTLMDLCVVLKMLFRLARFLRAPEWIQPSTCAQPSWLSALTTNFHSVPLVLSFKLLLALPVCFYPRATSLILIALHQDLLCLPQHSSS